MKILGEPGTVRQVEPSTGCGDSCAIVLSDGDPTASWRFDLFAQTETRGAYYVGTLVSAPAGTATRARVLGWAGCPGAVNWHALVRPMAGTPAEAMADVEISIGSGFGGGLVANGPLATVTFT